MATECDEFDPPKEIIQHIQSFLNTKQAARTSIISKTWFTSWITRPHLVFDMRDFQLNGCSGKFSSLYKKTVQRYKESNLIVEKFSFFITVRDYVNDAALADELIAHALTLGANDVQVGIEVKVGFMDYKLPVHVFALTSLTRLSLTFCDINHLIDGGVFCSSLKSLSLRFVTIKDHVLCDILLKCPLIQDLDLRYCTGLKTVNVSNMHNLAKLFVSGTRSCSRVEDNDIIAAFTTNSQTNEFRYLRQLHLKGVKMDNKFFTEFSSRFPCIEDLILQQSYGYKEINISSRSLRYLNLRQKWHQSWLKEEIWKGMQFNVPNISKLVLETDNHILS